MKKYIKANNHTIAGSIIGTLVREGILETGKTWINFDPSKYIKLIEEELSYYKIEREEK